MSKAKNDPARHLVDIGTIVQGLHSRIDQLCLELLPNGKRAGMEWEVGSLDGEPGRSLKVHLTGSRAGVWKDFAGGGGGDALDLVALVAHGGDKSAALRWARRWLGLDVMDPAELQAQRQRLAARAAAATKQQETDDAATRERCLRLWLGASDQLLGSPVDSYLAGRGIRLDRLKVIPHALRFARALYNRESGREWLGMVACINRLGESKLVGVHRTWLTVRGDGSVVKAPLVDPKMSWGKYRGGFIPLARGKSGKPMAEAPEDDVVALSEGIEDGLTIALARPDLRTLCAVSLSNMMTIDLPPQIREIVIAGQNDAAGSDAAEQLERVVERFTRQGRRVRVARAPSGIKDFNDMIRGAAVSSPAQEVSA